MIEFLRNPPIIIIGMHRSGTSMITTMLRKMGLFIGNKLDYNCEACFFQNINRWILHQSGGTWDNPSTINYILEDSEIRTLTLDYMDYMIKTPRFASYLGWRKYLLSLTNLKSDMNWGWKDPRTTFTIPLWLEIFPAAKVIHILRHGVDVAKSIVDRRRILLARYKKLYPLKKTFYWLRPEKDGFAESLRCSNMDRAFVLWEEYITEAQKYVTSLSSRAFELKYEEFLAAPVEKLHSLSLFCNLVVSNDRLAKIAEDVDKSRAYAYLKDPKLLNYAYRLKARLQLHGY